MLNLKKNMLSALLAVVLIAPLLSQAQGLGKVAARAAMNRMLVREAERDAATTAVRAARGHQLMRYTTRAQARAEIKEGLVAGRHLTGTTEGRVPLTAEAAQKRYGIPISPEIRETWRVPKGWPERPNPVWKGASNAKEITSPRPLPPYRLIRVEKLPTD